MLIKTKKYQLDKKLFVSIAMNGALKTTWWFLLIPAVILLASPFLPGMGWFIALGIILGAGFFLFWWIQFTGLTQMEQGEMMFKRYNYEISSQQILMKVSAKQGMPIQWNQIKNVVIRKDGFVLYLSKAQLFFFPFKIFNNDNEIKFLKSILERKALLKK